MQLLKTNINLPQKYVTSADFEVSVSIFLPMVGVWAMTWFIRYIHVGIYSFINNVAYSR